MNVFSKPVIFSYAIFVHVFDKYLFFLSILAVLLQPIWNNITMPSEKKRVSNEKNGDGSSEPKLNKTSSDFGSINFECDKKSKEGKESNFKISSWNVAGLRAWIKKDGLDFLNSEKPDVICLQEIKCSEDKLPPEIKVNSK